jgi:hypothetical protein
LQNRSMWQCVFLFITVITIFFLSFLPHPLLSSLTLSFPPSSLPHPPQMLPRPRSHVCLLTSLLALTSMCTGATTLLTTLTGIMCLPSQCVCVRVQIWNVLKKLSV